MLPVSTGVIVFDAIVLVAEPIVPFATRVMVILSPIFAYMLFFVLLLSIVNVSSPSGFACTVTVLFIESGTLPAASARAEYVMFCSPSDDVFKFVGKAVMVCVYEGLLGSDTLAPRST